MALKYQLEINGVNEFGNKCPPEELAEPKDIAAFRFVFEDPLHSKNHIPVGIHNPKRVLTENEGRKCFLYSLSCFTRKDSAIAFFDEYKRNLKQFDKIVGNMISEGTLNEKDGLISKPGKHTHFELFEYPTCNLSAKFEPTHKLI